MVAYYACAVARLLALGEGLCRRHRSPPQLRRRGNQIDGAVGVHIPLLRCRNSLAEHKPLAMHYPHRKRKLLRRQRYDVDSSHESSRTAEQGPNEEECTMDHRDDQPVLITGGTGFIASYLAMELLKRGEHVVLFDRDPDMRRLTGYKDAYNMFAKQVTFVQGDVSLLPHVLAVFDAHTPKSVFHLGALLSAGAESNPTMGFQTDTVGTWNVLEGARLYCQKERQPPVRVVFPSTIASFGLFIAPGAKVPNEAPQLPTTM